MNLSLVGVTVLPLRCFRFSGWIGKVAFLIVVLCGPGLAEELRDNVTSFAGSGVEGAGDGFGPSAGFYFPFGVAVDVTGAVYITDSNNQTIRKISSDGVVTTLAGIPGVFGAIDGPAAQATFSSPQGVAVDLNGNVYVADTNNHAIRKIGANGVVTTLAGSPGVNGFSDGKGTIALFDLPVGLAVDGAGNVYVADCGNQVIRKVSPMGEVSTLAGLVGNPGAINGSVAVAQFSGPQGVAVDGTGNVYVADTHNHAIRKISADGAVTTLAGELAVQGQNDGMAAHFNSPFGVAVDGSGNVYIADTWNGTIRRVTTGGLVTTLAGTAGTSGAADGKGAAAQFAGPRGLAVDLEGDVFVADSDNNLVRNISLPGVQLITTSPASQTVAAGYGLVLKGGATSRTGVTLQWQKNGRNIPGATSSTYALAAVTADDAGWYRLIATDSAGSDNSALAVVTVIPGVGAPAGVSGDLDGDGRPDLFWQNTTTGERSFWLMQGLLLKQGVALGTFAPDWSIAGTGDFNRDGHVDLIWQNSITGECSLWLMNRTTMMVGVALGFFSTNLTIAGTGDFNGDGSIDIVWQNVASGERCIQLMNGTSPGGQLEIGSLSVDWAISAVGDFNGDAKPDLVWQNARTGEVSVTLMNGTFVMSIQALGVVSRQLQAVGTGDFNGDGMTDLVWTDIASGERSFWLMNGTTRTSVVRLAVVSPAWSLGRAIFLVSRTARSDFNSDGKPDLVIQNELTGERRLLLMDGVGATSSVSLGTISTDWVISATGDFNRDEKVDLVWTNIISGERAIWLMDGSLHVSTLSLGIIPNEWVIAATADFNYDGKTDLVWTNFQTGERSLWLMNDAVFGFGIALGTIPLEWSIGVATDMNGDGKTDLIWQNTITGESSIWLMNGGNFSAGVALPAMPPDRSFVGCGDFNGDGKMDLLLQNNVTRERSVWLMNGMAYQATASLGAAPQEWSYRN